MEKIKRRHQKKFSEEITIFFNQRISSALIVGIFLIPLFSLLDFVVVRGHFSLFLLLRVFCSALLVVLYYLHRTEKGGGNPFTVTVMADLVIGLTISTMVVHLGGYDSYYYVGIVLILVVTAALLPLNLVQCLSIGAMLYLIYCLPVFVFSPYNEEKLSVFFNNSFFFLSFILISLVKCHEDIKARKREFNLRMELDTANERLLFYANNLEEEVDKRANALEESELRYKQLYENIVDMVILVDANGNILMANPRFYALCEISDTEMLNLAQFIFNEDKDRLKKHLFADLLQERDVKDFEFKMISGKGKVYDVECNAKCIKRNQISIGFQMVIRDITQRKNLTQRLLRSYRDTANARTATILGLAKLAEYRDESMGAHLERIREYVKIIANNLAGKPEFKSQIGENFIRDIYFSCILHDIGKVGIPDSILLKPARLTNEEFEIIKRHTEMGGNALSEVEKQIDGKSFLTVGKEIAYFHHEWWNGSGYPEGLKGEQIPLSARITAIADVYDALTSDRVYKKAYPHEKARQIIISNRGIQFDPTVVEAFLAHEDDFLKVKNRAINDNEMFFLAAMPLSQSLRL